MEDCATRMSRSKSVDGASTEVRTRKKEGRGRELQDRGCILSIRMQIGMLAKVFKAGVVKRRNLQDTKLVMDG